MRAVALALLLLASPALAGEAGPARVIDGDSLEVSGEEIRLFGIDAPEIGQVCALEGASWDCGRASAVLLRRLVRGHAVDCQSFGRDRDGRLIAKCHAGWMDLSAEMVSRGMAVVDPNGAPDYLPNYREARALGDGIFAAEFIEPARWRRGERLPLEPDPLSCGAADVSRRAGAR